MLSSLLVQYISLIGWSKTNFITKQPHSCYFYGLIMIVEYILFELRNRKINEI